MTLDQITIFWFVIAVIGISICILVVTEYLDKINARRHPLAKLQSSFSDEKSTKGKVSPQSELILGCIFIILSIVMFALKGKSIIWLVPAMFMFAGLRSVWVFIKSVKNNKT